MVLTLSQILRQRAAEQPRSLAYTFLKNGQTPDGELSYAELDMRARRLAAFLLEGEPSAGGSAGDGERLLLLFPAGLDVPVAFFGCLAAGKVAVPAPPPETAHLRRALPRLQAIVEDCGARRVLTTGAIAEAMLGLGEQQPQSPARPQDLLP